MPERMAFCQYGFTMLSRSAKRYLNAWKPSFLEKKDPRQCESKGQRHLSLWPDSEIQTAMGEAGIDGDWAKVGARRPVLSSPALPLSLGTTPEISDGGRHSALGFVLAIVSVLPSDSTAWAASSPCAG